MSEKEAISTLQELNLKVNVTYSEDTNKANGIVLSQSQKQNAEVEEGSLIELTVNRIQKSKVVTIPVANFVESETEEDVTLKVVAKVEGVSNTIYEKKVSAPYDSVDVSVNGYTTATLSIYIDGTLKNTQNVTF